MKFIIIISSILLFSFSSFAKKEVSKGYGKKLSLKKSQTVTELLDKPKAQINQHVSVTGRVKEVCPMKGCWLNLEDPKTKKIIKVKVKDDVIVFPTTAINKTATVEGKLVKKMMSKEKAIRYYRHLAEEMGKPFDPKSVTGPMEMWEIKGTGAIIQ